MQVLTRDQIAARAARDIQEGWYVNLGIGLPTLVSSHIPAGREIVFHSENGILGLGPRPTPDQMDPDLIDAGKSPATTVKGASFFSHNDAFVMIRGGHLDLSLMGGLEVSRRGDLANWTTDDPATPPGVGGAMDLAMGARQIWILMEHTTKSGAPRIREKCTLPLTCAGRVSRVYTNMAVMDVREDGLYVREMVAGVTLQDLQRVTEAQLRQDSAGAVLDDASKRC
ncbi:MAG: 3-oxoacid CoA-transferase subunit B [Burkholderiaceae bacterium]|nr:3-oxoacid CoA-transferase subunit B [Burkholderiaceae bacterium]